MANGMGAFVSGLVGGYTAGTRLNMEQEDQAARKKLLGIQTEEAQRKLDAEKGADATWQQLADIVSPGAQPSAAGGLQPGNLGDESVASAGPGLQPQGPQNPQDRVGFGIYQNPSAFFGNPQKLQAAATLFMRSPDPTLRVQGINWLQAGYKAQKENLIDAVRSAASGDLAGAEKAFNTTGDHQVQPGSLKWADANHTTLTGMDQTGKPFEVKPQELMKQFLSPEAFFKQQNAERKATLDESAKGAEAGLKTAQTKLAEAQTTYYATAKTALTNAQAAKASGAGDGTLTPKQLNTVIDKGGLALRRMLEAEQPKEDAKYNVNGMMSLLPDMQAEMGQAIRGGTDPEVALQKVYNATHDRVSALNDALAQVSSDANGKWTSSGKDAAMKAGLTNLMQQYSVTPADIKKYLPATKLAKGDMDRVRSVLGSVSAGKVAAPAAAAVATPKTQADFDALKKGDRFVNPADGKTYTKN